MIKKFVIFAKYLGIISGVLIAVISCEKDFKNIESNLVENNVFTTDSIVSEVIAYSKDVESNKTNSLSHYLLGTAENGDFKKLNASIVSQLTLPIANPDFGEHAVIDSIILNIPFEATLLGNIQVENPSTGEMISVPEFEIDSLWQSGTDPSFLLKVHELGTFLHIIDLLDPTKVKEYFSNIDINSFDKIQEFYSENVSLSANDTMSIIKRYKFTDDTFTETEFHTYDTIKNISSKPSLKIPLDKQDFTDFQSLASSSEFSTNADFQHYFKGLYLEAFDNGLGNSLIALNISGATMTLYYTETSYQDEGDDGDLNDNGITGEQNVQVVRTDSFIYTLSGAKVNLFDRDVAGSLVENYIETPNMTEGEDKIFVQGAAGIDAIIQLFGEDADANDIPDELEALRLNNWLINDAQLSVYIDPENTSDPVPEYLYLYNIENENENIDAIIEYIQTYDAMHQGPDAVSGVLERDADENPYRYVFHITDYISEIIKTDSEVIIRDFGIKTFDGNDMPLSPIDTILRKYNNNHKGVVLTGNVPITEENRIKLEIFYTEIND